MKKILLISILGCFFLTVAGQNVRITENIPAENVLISTYPFVAKVYEFDGEINSFQPDSVHPYLFAQVSGSDRFSGYGDSKSRICLLDLDSGQVRWSKEFKFRRKAIRYTPKGILVESKGKTSLLDLEGGKTVWTRKLVVREIVGKDHLLLAYEDPFKKKLAAKLSGTDILTGKTLWERELNYNQIWEEQIALSDTTFLISSNGLHFYHLTSGSGWDYLAKTQFKNYKKAILNSMMGLTLGVVTGFGFYQTSPERIIGVCSNALVNGSAFYTANSRSIAKIDLSGKIIWEEQLPAKGSGSHLFLKGDSLFMLNYGQAKYNQQYASGDPFMACFDPETGGWIYHHKLNNGGHSVKDHLETPNGLYLLFENGISYGEPGEYDFEFIRWKKNPADPDLLGFVRQAFLYDQPTGSFRKSDDVKNQRMFIYDERGQVFEVNDRLEVLRTYGFKELFYEIDRWNNYIYVQNGKSQVCILNENGKLIAGINPGNPFFRIDKNKLFILSDDNRIYEIDLNQLLDENRLAIN